MLKDQVKSDTRNNNEELGDDYLNLRNLLLGSDYESILEERLNSSDTQRVANVLAEAFHQRNQKDDALASQMSPVIESAIDSSIKNNPSRITNVIFPIMGPAVRKAVASAFADVIHSLNHLLQQSLTAKALIWRFQAWRIGVSYGEYVLLKTIQYRVEQIFLIHKSTGLLIQSCAAQHVENQEPDLISAMLTAITDFVSDSFHSDTQEDQLNVIQFGQLSILVESGPYAIVAFVVRGAVNSEVNQRLLELVEKVHSQFNNELEVFNGDSESMQACLPLLQESLIEKRTEVEKTRPWLALSALALVFIFVSILILQEWKKQQLVDEYLLSLKEQTGYIVLDSHIIDNTLAVDLLRSPSSLTIDEFKQQHSLEKLKVIYNEKLASLNDTAAFIASLQIQYDAKLKAEHSESGDILKVEGKIAQDDLDRLKSDPVVKSLFTSLNLIDASIIIPKSKKEQYRESFRKLANRINNQNFYFNLASTELLPESLPTVEESILTLKEILALQQKANFKLLQISVFGFTDFHGNQRLNKNLSEQRAKIIVDIFKANGIDSSILVSWGYGEKDQQQVPEEMQRRVSLRVLYKDVEELPQ